MDVAATKGYALTQNGNQYKKSTTARKVGVGVSATAGAVLTAGGISEAIKIGLPVGKFIAGGASVTGVWTLASLGIGYLVDKFIIDKQRKEQADGEAVVQQKLSLNA